MPSPATTSARCATDSMRRRWWRLIRSCSANMCGIAGFVNRSIARDEGDAVLGEMLSRIVHRGPDGEGRLVAAELGLFAGMRRLSIIDLAGGDQPIWNEDRTVAALFNGEIYNYLELAADLKARGHRFATRSDTEVLVHLYEEHGADLVRHLRGMFGFCLFDTRRRRLLLGRDPFGQKPLYFFRGGGVFAFGSEIKALHALPFADSSLRPGALPDFLAWYGLPPGETHFRHIEKLPAGSTMEVCLVDGPRCAEPKVFWRFEAQAPPDLTEMDDAAEALDAALDESASVHLRADVPVGVLLSSGLDSKVILTYAKRRAQDQLAAFSVGFRGAGRESELPGARETARSLGVRHECIEVGAEDLADSVEEIAWHLDEPVGDHACFAVRAVCRLAKQSVKVLLSGEGADELFGGYEERYLGRLDTMERSSRLRRWRTLLPRTATPFPAGRFGRLCQRAHLGEAAEMASLHFNGFPFDRRAPMGFTPDQLQRFAARIEEVGARVVSRSATGCTVGWRSMPIGTWRNRCCRRLTR
ncbi:MAG: asparagine synthase (glutamine-hydrolyzing) [Verrucomicrobiales bacterium]